MTGVQETPLNADPYGDGKIYLPRAWPKDWDVDFKLHTTENTTVEVSVKQGVVESLRVSPPTRMKDVVVDSRFKVEKP